MNASTGYNRPLLGSRLLFFMLLAGPPKFRLRDVNASLEGAIDWVVLLHLIVWVCAGIWVLRRTLREWGQPNHSPLTRVEQCSIALFVLLGVSVIFSAAPAFSAFKVYQLIVTFAFIKLFAETFGVAELFNNLFWGCGILAIADIVAALVMPDLVIVESELGAMRFRGDLIAQTGAVSATGLLLLLTVKSDLPLRKFLFWFVTFGGVLVSSLMRTSYILLLFVLFLAALRRPAIPVMRKFVAIALMSLPFLFGLLMSALDSRREVEDIWTLSDRVGLWSYLIDATVSHGPWLGLGYFAASRVYAPEYNPGLGTAHSAFIEIYVGGGMLSLFMFVSIWAVLAWQTAKLYFARSDKTAFAVVALFCAALLLNTIGGELQSDASGFCFWCVVVSLPIVAKQLPVPEHALTAGAR